MRLALLLLATLALMASAATGEPIRLQGLELNTATSTSSLAGRSRAELERAAQSDVRTRMFLVHVTDIAKVDGERLKTALGLHDVQYLPRNTFTFGGTLAQAAAARELDGVDWVSEMTTEWKTASFKKASARATLAAGQGEAVTLAVMIVPHPSGAYSAEQLVLIERDVAAALVDAGIADATVAPGPRRFSVQVPPQHVATAVQALARVPEVSWVEPRMRVHALGLGMRPGGPRLMGGGEEVDFA